MISKKPVTIMLVDDNHELRTALKRRLERHNYRVVDFALGEEAITFATQHLNTVSYAFIDHVLQPGMIHQNAASRWDGIETTRQLMALNPNLCIVVFSGQAEISADERHKALEAGARRYVHKRGGIEIEHTVLDFIHELETLRELSELAQEIRQQRDSITTTLREVPVGTLLIDRTYFPWVASADWRRIEEKIDPLHYPLHRLADSVVGDPFRKRLLDAALSGEEKDELALCTIPPGKLKYLHVWARPIRNDQGHVIACSLSMVNQTASHVVTHMPLTQRMGLLTKAIRSARYDRVRLYRASDDEKYIIGVAEAGGGLLVPFEGYPITIDKADYLRTTIDGRQPRFWRIDETDDFVRTELGKTADFIIYPLFGPGRLIGLLAVDMEFHHAQRPLVQEDIRSLIPYAEEARKALLEAATPRGEGQHEPDGLGLAKVWTDIDQCTDPEKAMGIVIQAVRDLTDCDAAHIRVRQENQAIMVASVGEYPRYRPRSLPLDDHYWFVRVMQTGQPIIVQNIVEMRKELFEERKTWSLEAEAAFSRAKSFAIFPLLYGQTLGALEVLVPEVNHFTEERRGLLQSLGRLAATSWVDLSRARDRQHAAQRDVAFSTVHNLRQPTMALRGAIQRILNRHAKGILTIEYAAKATQDALIYLQRSESIITDVLRYLTPLSLRKRVAVLRTYGSISASGSTFHRTSWFVSISNCYAKCLSSCLTMLYRLCREMARLRWTLRPFDFPAMEELCSLQCKLSSKTMALGSIMTLLIGFLSLLCQVPLRAPVSG